MDKSARKRQVLRATAQMLPFEALIGAKKARLEPASVRFIASLHLLALGDHFSDLP
jgi:hypothetical protein